MVRAGRGASGIVAVSELQVSVAPGRGQAGLQGFFLRLKTANAKVEAVATDMAGGYTAAVLKYLPKARLVFDHFHVIKLMNEKLTILRRDLYRELKGNMQMTLPLLNLRRMNRVPAR